VLRFFQIKAEVTEYIAFGSSHSEASDRAHS
jgi:hypothetical protein